jgi:hypothetical protein
MANRSPYRASRSIRYLTLVCAISLLVACGGDDEPDSTPTPSATTQPTVAAPATPVATPIATPAPATPATPAPSLIPDLGTLPPGTELAWPLSAKLKNLPPSPLQFQLIRTTIAAGDNLSPLARPGPQLVSVEAGSLALSGKGEVAVQRAGEPSAITNDLAQGLSIAEGDSLLIPAETRVAVSNNADTAAVVLDIAIIPTAKLPPSGGLLYPTSFTRPSQGQFELLARGQTDELPPESSTVPADVALGRLSLPADAELSWPERPGVELIAVESGSVELSTTAGKIRVWRGTAMEPGAEGTPELFADDTSTILRQRDSAFFRPAASGVVSNGGNEPANLLLVIVSLDSSTT